MGIGDALALEIDGHSAVEMLFPNLMIGMLAMVGVAGVDYFFRRVVHQRLLPGCPTGQDICRRPARRLASRAPAVTARIAEPTRTIEVACFLRYSLMISTDHLLWMVRRRVADLWRKAAEEADAQGVNYERLYQQLK
jgi:hypothetical protein